MPIFSVLAQSERTSRLAMVVAFAVASSLLVATFAPSQVDAASDENSTTGIPIIRVPITGGGSADAINDSGAIVGRSDFGDRHAFYWNGQAGHPVDERRAPAAPERGPRAYPGDDHSGDRARQEN